MEAQPDSMQVEEDEDLDETPAFLGEGDAVEVVVDDDNVPMDDDDDDDDDGGAMGTTTDQGMTDGDNNDDDTPPFPDMAQVVITSHSEPVYAVACHATNHGTLRILSGGGDDKACWQEVSILDLQQRQQQQSHYQTLALESHYQYKDSVSAIAFNSPFIHFDTTKPPNPEWVAVGALDGSIVLYGNNNSNNNSNNNTNSIEIQTLEGPTSDIEWLCWHPKGGNVVLVGSSDATIWMYHTSLKKCLQVFVGHEGAVTCGKFSADGKVALSASADGTLRIWAPKIGKSKHVFRFNSNDGGPPAALNCMETHGGTDQQLVIVGSEDGQAHICHVANKKHVASLRHYEAPPLNATATATTSSQDDDEEEEVMLPSSVEAVGFSQSNPNWCATGGMDGVLKIWDLANQGQCRHTCYAAGSKQSQTDATNTNSRRAGGDGITRLQWHPTLPLVITSTCRGQVHVWDARNGQLVQTLTGHEDVINDMGVAFVPSIGVSQQQQQQQPGTAGHAVIVTGSDDNTVRVFDLDLDAALLKAAQQLQVQ